MLRKIKPNLLQRRPNIQINPNLIRLNRRLKVRQMLIADHTRIPQNVNGQDGVLVLGSDEADDGELLDLALHRAAVVAGSDDEVGEESGADGLVVDGEVHGYVAEVDGHDGGVGDVDCAEHVGAVGEELGAAREDGYVGDGEAGEFVEAW